MTPDRNLFSLALRRLKEQTGIAGVLKADKGSRCFRLTLKTPDRKATAEFIAEAKGTAGSGEIMDADAQHLLVTEYVNPDQSERFRDNGVQFIDCAGNAYINTAALYLYIKGNKPAKTIRTQPARLFKPGGLKVAFLLLSNPDLVACTFRDIAAMSKVSLGTVAWVMRDMQRQGFVIETGKGERRLVKRADMLRLWLVGYEQILRPTLPATRYHAENQDWWRDANIGDALWGGDVAAWKMTEYLKPERVKLHAEKMPDRLVLQFRLRMDPGGEIEVVNPFWDFEYPERKKGLAPPLLVYADLLAEADGRTLEAARIVYERYLARHLAKD